MKVLLLDRVIHDLLDRVIHDQPINIVKKSISILHEE